LNEGSESEQSTHPVDLRDDGIDINLPSREEIEGALKYMRNNKAAHADSFRFTIVMCCVKIKNDCSESFETRQGLRQGDVLSTLFFNVVLEVVFVRRANQSTTKKHNYSHMPMI
jgi:hypothetical protein